MATGLAKPVATGDANAFDPNADRVIQTQLRRAGQYVRWVELGSQLLTLLIGTLVFFLAAAFIDHWIISLGWFGRWLFCLTFIGGCGWFVVTRVLPLLIRAVNPAYSARAIEEATPSLKNSLLNFILLKNDHAGVKTSVLHAIQARAASDISGVEVETTIDRAPLIRVGYILCGVLAVVALYKIASPKDPFQTAARVVAPWADLARPSRVLIREVQPGHTSVYIGSTVEVTADVQGARGADAVRLIYSTADGQVADKVIVMKNSGGGNRYVAKLPAADSPQPMGRTGLQQGVQYHIEAGDAESSIFEIRVRQAPTIAVERVELNFPAYTLKAPQSQPSGEIKALEGTRVIIHARANQAIKSAYLELDPKPGRASETIPLTVAGEVASGGFTLQLKADRVTPWRESYQVRFTNELGEISEQPVRHNLEVIADLPPEVEILQPRLQQIDLPEDGRLTIEARGVDPDFALFDLHVVGKVPGSELFRKSLLPAGAPQSQASGKFEFVPAQYNLKAGAVVKYQAIAIDNRRDPLTGQPQPSRAQTAEYTINIVAPRKQNPNAAQNQNPNPNQQQNPEQPKPGENNPPPMPKPNENKPNQPNQPMPMPGENKPPMPGENPAKPEENANNNQNPQQPNQPQPNNGNNTPQPNKQQPNKPNEGQQQNQNQNEQQNNSGQSGSGQGQSTNNGQGNNAQPGSGNGQANNNNQPNQQQPMPGDNQNSGNNGNSQNQPGGNAGQPGGQNQPGGSNPGNPGQEASPQDGNEGDPSNSNVRPGGQNQPGSQNNKPQHDGEKFEKLLENLKKELERQKQSGGTGQQSPNNAPSPNNSQPSAPQKLDGQGSKPGASDNKPGEQNEKGSSDQLPTEQQLKELERMVKELQSKNNPEGNSPKPQDQTAQNGQPAGQPMPGQQQPGGQQPMGQQQPNGQPTPSGANNQPMPGAGQQPMNPMGASNQPKPEQGQPQNGGAQNQQNPKPNEGGSPQGPPRNEGNPQQPMPKPGEQKNPGAGQNTNTGNGGEQSKDPTGSAQGNEQPQGKPMEAPGNNGGNPNTNETSNPAQGKKSSNTQGSTSGEQRGQGKQGPGDSGGAAGNDSAGNNSPGDEGAGKANEPGKGETGNKAGKGPESANKTGQPGGKNPGEGTATKPGEKGSETGKGGQPGKPGEKGGNEPGGSSGGGNRVGPASKPTGDGSGGDRTGQGITNKSDDAADEANLNYTKRVTDLVLQSLRDQEHNPDPDLAKRTGLTPQELQEFSRRWSQLKKDAETDPAKARELDEALRSLGMRDPKNRRRSESTTDKQRDLRDAGGRTQAPSKYREQFEQFRKSAGAK